MNFTKSHVLFPLVVDKITQQVSYPTILSGNILDHHFCIILYLDTDRSYMLTTFDHLNLHS